MSALHLVTFLPWLESTLHSMLTTVPPAGTGKIALDFEDHRLVMFQGEPPTQSPRNTVSLLQTGASTSQCPNQRGIACDYGMSELVGNCIAALTVVIPTTVGWYYHSEIHVYRIPSVQGQNTLLTPFAVLGDLFLFIYHALPVFLSVDTLQIELFKLSNVDL